MSKYKFVAIGVLMGSLQLSSFAWSDSLEQVVKQALDNHPQTLVELKKVQIRKEKINNALSGYWPTLDIDMGVGGQKRWLPPSQQTSPTTTHDNSYTRKEGTISLKQNLFSGFSTQKSVEEARHLASVEAYERNSNLEGLALKVTTAYMNVLESLELMKLSKSNVMFHDDTYKKIKKKKESGVVGSSDLIQIEVKRARSKANFVNSRLNLEYARANYYSLVGAVVAEELLPPNVAKLQIPKSFSDALKISRNEHPDVIKADYKIQAAEAYYASQKSRYLPKLDLEIDQSWKTNVDGQQDTTENLVAMARISYNLFRGGADLSLVKESAYMVEESRAEKEAILRMLEEKLQRAWDNYELITVEIGYLRQQELSAKELVESYVKQFLIGKKDLLDLLDAKNELFEASKNLITSTYADSLSRYEILASLGQLSKEFNLAWNDE
ncbi:MAG: TolC family outer membrane protein [Candidatus Endonucleobacter sp. (ex Gigantidas childressi)]|nr:TolC family outer membrane protein [Candidatus Endonucleobacter sp. (ex Gigantidas childressi)]